MTFEQTLDQIDATALKILQEIGIALYHPQICEQLADSGIRISDNRAFFTPEQIEEWLDKAPSEFTLEARNSEHTIQIGGDNIVCVPGYGCASLVNRDGSRRDGTMNDFIQFAKLAHQSPHLQLNGGILVQPLDIPIDASRLAMLYATLCYSDKCPVIPPGSEKEMTRSMELMSIAFGGCKRFMESYKTITFISTLSPLKIDRMALDSMLVSARYKQPMLISPAPAAGTTGPINLAGNLAMAAAEALTGVVIAQILSPGIPVVSGINCAGADMRSGNISIGSPAVALQLRYSGALLKRYGIPSRGGGALTDAKIVSAQSGFESMLTLKSSFENKINLVCHAAGILDSFSGMSVDKFLMDLEMIRMIKAAHGEIEIESEDDLSFETIRQTRDTGQFLTTLETLSRCRTHSWSPQIGVRGVRDKATYDIALTKNLDDRLLVMLADYQRPVFTLQTITAMEEYLLENSLDVQTLARIKATDEKPDNKALQSPLLRPTNIGG